MLVKNFVPWPSTFPLCKTNFFGLFQKAENRLFVLSCFSTEQLNFFFCLICLSSNFVPSAEFFFAVIESEKLTIVKIFCFFHGRTNIVLNLFQMCLLDITRSDPVSEGL